VIRLGSGRLGLRHGRTKGFVLATACEALPAPAVQWPGAERSPSCTNRY
jgi:predicted phage tail protein